MKKTLIIGATGGIGTALAQQIAKTTDNLTLTGRSKNLSPLARSLKADCFQLELSDELEVNALMEEVGSLDLLIYAAGAIDPQTVQATSQSSWEQIMAANLTGAFYALKHAQLNTHAQVVLLGAYAETIQFPNLASYAAAKAGLEVLATVARKERRREKIKVILVRLPAVETDLWRSFGKAPKGALSADVAADRILSQLGTAADCLNIKA